MQYQTKTNKIMYKVYTKNGVALFISLCDDVEPNKGGYYCEVYLDEDGITEFDNFVIHKEDLDCFENKNEAIILHCEAYANGVDDIPILNKKFSTICDLIKDADAMGNDFYMRHILYNKNMSKNNSGRVSGKSHNPQQLNHYANQKFYTYYNILSILTKLYKKLKI